jgi:choline dehydrogenase
MDETRQRVSSESAYLTKDVLARPNLVVVLHAHVTRVVCDDNGTRAVAVEFAKSKSGPVYQARARQEIILSYAQFVLLPS